MLRLPCKPVVLCLALLFAMSELVRADASAPAQNGPAGTYRVYIGTFTTKKSKGIYRMQFDAKSGSLSQPELAVEGPSPSFLALAPNHQFLYSTNEVEKLDGKREGGVSAFSIDATSGNLTLLNRQYSMGRSPTHIVIDSQGKNVLVANYSTGGVAVFPVQSDGRLQPASSFDQHKGRGADPSRQEGPHAHCINIDPTGHFALSCDLGLDKVFIYKFDSATGTIAPNTPPFATVAPNSGPRHLAFHPNGKWVYVVNEMACTVTGFSWDAQQGKLSEIQTIATLPSDFKGQKSTAEIMVDPAGKFLYASNRGDANSIATFQIDPQTGSLKSVGQVSTGGKAPRYFTLDPTGNWLLAANQDTDNVVVFQIDRQTGSLKPTGVNIQVPTPVCILFLPMDH